MLIEDLEELQECGGDEWIMNCLISLIVIRSSLITSSWLLGQGAGHVSCQLSASPSGPCSPCVFVSICWHSVWLSHICTSSSRILNLILLQVSRRSTVTTGTSQTLMAAVNHDNNTTPAWRTMLRRLRFRRSENLLPLWAHPVTMINSHHLQVSCFIEIISTEGHKWTANSETKQGVI